MCCSAQLLCGLIVRPHTAFTIRITPSMNTRNDPSLGPLFIRQQLLIQLDHFSMIWTDRCVCRSFYIRYERRLCRELYGCVGNRSVTLVIRHRSNGGA
ncbi:hypothetical protein BKA58DRAFT_63153 [Alternaria rosae]|uniref:uncharacterized protein n=1 Tax=Alternaria rosae TaxID=1187941 RepID=UPI001E8E6A91|nr:uncharacterized protein BKA58DRAFT_63153 [Alternaria rosae]KAH6852931.1 hypothetical protein BKA58DRAFT_63153 [Alternaria rosae]